MSEYVHGIFNAAKCVRYLRGIGVEITDAQAAEWGDAERADRACRRVAVQGVEWTCVNGHTIYLKRKRGTRRMLAEACEKCGGRWRHMSTRYFEFGDGRVHDYREKAERWKDRDAPPSGECP